MLAAAGQAQVARLTEKMRYRNNAAIYDMMPQGAERIRALLRFKNYDGTLDEFCKEMRERAENFSRVQRAKSTFMIVIVLVCTAPMTVLEHSLGVVI